MPTIPVNVVNPDSPGFEGVVTSSDSVSVTHNNDLGVKVPIVSLIFDGTACFLRLCNIRESHGLFAAPIYRNSNGDPIVLSPTGVPLNGDNVDAY